MFADGPDEVVKVLRPGFSDALGEAEAAAAALADRAGIGAPRFLGTTRVGGRFALRYERRDGPSMLQRLTSRPVQAGHLGRMLGELHAAMHDAPAASLPDSVAELRRAIIAAERHAGPAATTRALERVDGLQAGDSLCHGDFHPGNVVMSADGPSVIDWLTAGSGPPAADVARTLFLLRDGRIPPELPAPRRAFITILRRQFARAYLHAYRRRRGLDLSEVTGWRLPILVGRLDEDVEHEREHVLRLIANEVGRGAGVEHGAR